VESPGPLEVPGLLKINMAAMESYYYVVLILSLLAIYLFRRIVGSPWVDLQGIRTAKPAPPASGLGP